VGNGERSNGHETEFDPIPAHPRPIISAGLCRVQADLDKVLTSGPYR
jgi:hypothetical protein